MAEYIEREAAMLTPVLPKEHRHYQTSNLDDVYAQGWADALDNLKNAPAAAVAPVRHGRWDDSIDEWFGTDVYTCSKCRESYVLVEGTPKENLWHYCPNCGAKMDGEDGDGND